VRRNFLKQLFAVLLVPLVQEQEPKPAPVYKIALYDGGSQIGNWNGKDVSEAGPWMFFTDADSGAKMTIQGTIIVTGPEEVQDRVNEGL
jgi:hypothetical protein